MPTPIYLVKFYQNSNWVVQENMQLYSEQGNIMLAGHQNKRRSTRSFTQDERSRHENVTFMREKIALARCFTKLTENQKMTLIDKVKNIVLTGKLEYFKKKNV